MKPFCSADYHWMDELDISHISGIANMNFVVAVTINSQMMIFYVFAYFIGARL